MCRGPNVSSAPTSRSNRTILEDAEPIAQHEVKQTSLDLSRVWPFTQSPPGVAHGCCKRNLTGASRPWLAAAINTSPSSTTPAPLNMTITSRSCFCAAYQRALLPPVGPPHGSTPKRRSSRTTYAWSCSLAPSSATSALPYLSTLVNGFGCKRMKNLTTSTCPKTAAMYTGVL